MRTASDPYSRTRLRRLQAALIIAGAGSVVSQVILLRELLVVSHGNELSLGLSLAGWLLLSGCGSAVAGRLWRYPSLRLFAVLVAVSAAALSCAIFLVRTSSVWLGVQAGETLGPLAILSVSAVSMSVYCPAAGALFAVGSRLWSRQTGENDALGCNAMYLFEAAGAALGGLLASVLLLQFFDSFQAGFLLLFATFVSSVWLLTHRVRSALLLSAIAAAVLWPALILAGKLDSASTGMRWHGFHLVKTANSRYGSLVVIEGEGTRTLLQNGTALFTSPDPLSAEESVHLALLEHAAPKRVLLVGGALNGSIGEVLKHPSVERVDFVELDPAILSATRESFPEVWQTLSANPRVHGHQTDGRLFLKSTSQVFDAIIMSLPEPQTAQINRYYTVEFFREAATRLSRGGVFSFRLMAGEEYRSLQRTEFLRSIYRSLRGAFPNVVVLPGETACFVASTAEDALTADPQVLISRLRERKVQTEYVSEYFLPYRLSPERVAALSDELKQDAHSLTNRDFTPIAYYYDVALWGTQFSSYFRSAFHAASAIRFSMAFAGLLVVVAIVIACCLPMAPLARESAGTALAVAVTGFTLITTQILLLLGFQVIYGFVFEELALIVAAFMAGTALGAWTALRTDTRRHSATSRLLFIQVLTLLLPMGIAAVLMAVADSRRLALVMVPLLALAAGAIGGRQFSTAAGVCLREGSPRISAGTLYACDLLGASFGALAVSIYMLPVFGFARTSVLVGALNLAPVVLLLWIIWSDRTRPA